MCEISISSYDLSTMCRLCLIRDVTLSDIFSFSTKMKNEVAVLIMKCAPVQITKDDDMPKSICQVCYTQLEKIYKFQTQIVQSEKILRQYLQQIQALKKQNTSECSIQRPIEEHFIQNYAAETTVKCEPFEFNDAGVNKKDESGNFNKNYEDIPFKSVVKDEPTDDDNLTPTECHDNTECILPNINYEDLKINIKDSELDENIDINCDKKELVNVNKRMTDKEPTNAYQINEEILLKSLVKDEPTDDDHSTPTNYHDDGNDYEDSKLYIKDSKLAESNDIYWEKKTSTIVNTRRKINEELYQQSEINDASFENRETNEDTKIDDGHTSDDLTNPHSANARNCFDNREEKNKNTTANRSKHKKTTKIDDKFEKHQCDVCNKCFSGSSYLKIHKRVHTGEIPYQCDVCNKYFSTPGTLRIHHRKHTGEKPYQCDVCSKCFSELGSLRIHRRIHTGEKPYQCDFCNKCFNTSYHLNTHKRTHTGEKPYHCDVCNKSYTQLGVLKIHKRTHTGEKPYQCDVCNTRFNRETSLNNHKRTHYKYWSETLLLNRSQ